MAAHSEHLILGVAALAAMLGLMSIAINRLIRRKLRLSVILLIAFLGAEVGVALYGANLSDPTIQQLAATTLPPRRIRGTRRSVTPARELRFGR